MKLIKYSEVFYEDVVNLYYAMTIEMNPTKIIGFKKNFYDVVSSWGHNVDIVLAIDGMRVVGFSMSYVNSNKGLVENDYFTELIYIKPENRGSRMFYMLMDNLAKYAEDLGLDHTSMSNSKNGLDKMLLKHGAKKGYNMEHTHSRIIKRIDNG